jgi:hypothetical protein
MKSINGDSYLDYPDARDSGELVGEDGRLPRVLASGGGGRAAGRRRRHWSARPSDPSCVAVREPEGGEGRAVLAKTKHAAWDGSGWGGWTRC